MLQHSFVLDSLETTGPDTFTHFESLIEEHRERQDDPHRPSRLQQIIGPTIGTFHTHLPLRKAFEVYNEKHNLTKRKHIQISFNELRHILNLAQIMALRKRMDASTESITSMLHSDMNLEFKASSRGDLLEEDNNNKNNDDEKLPFNGPQLICFDGDQTLYSDGANFESNPKLANYLYQLLRNEVFVAVVTAAGYEYKVEKYEYRLSGLLHYFQSKGLTSAECDRFYLFGGECNYLLKLGPDYRLHPVREQGAGGWCTSTAYLKDSPSNWNQEEVTLMLDLAQETVEKAKEELNLRARVIRKRRSVGLVPEPGREITRESLDETVLRVNERLQKMNDGSGASLPYCAFNGGSDAWVDVGNKRVGVEVLQSYLGIAADETLHIGDQFLNTGNDYAARAASPCIWIINPQETTYILKSILRLAGVSLSLETDDEEGFDTTKTQTAKEKKNAFAERRQNSSIDFEEMERRAECAKQMDVYTGEMMSPPLSSPSLK